MRHIVVGTAGHVDHGKTSLVEALTGVDCDRLAEEKRRGITIALGFAQWNVAPGLTASVIDVPGHERFVHTMVAGAIGMDVVLLVVAADDGVMPQTREHLAICELLGVTTAVIVATKVDLVDPGLLELVEQEIREVTAAGPFAEAPIVACSSRDGRGLEELARVVARVAGAVPPAIADGPPVLSVDRVFSKPGFGTIATGTLARGSIDTGQVLEVLPAPEGRNSVRVRGLFVHDREVPRAIATTRLALNLRGDGEGALARGTMITRPGWQRPTDVLDVELTLLAGMPPLRPRSSLMLHLGTAHVPVRLRRLPGRADRVIARLHCDAPIAAYAGQRFILRRPELDADRTVGGGVIVDPHPRRARRVAARTAALPFLEDADLEARLLAAAAETPDGIGPDAVRARLRPEEQGGVDTALARLVAAGRLLATAGDDGRKKLYARRHLDDAKAAFLAALRDFHEEHAALAGASAVELQGRLPSHLRALAETAMNELAREGALVAGGGRARLPDHDARHTLDRIAAAFAAQGLAPEGDEPIRRALGVEPRVFRDALADLRREGKLHRLAEGLHFHADPLRDVVPRVREHFAKQPTLSPVELKAILGLTRKHTMPLLEWLDAQGVTRRQGDVRVLAQSS